MFFYTVGPLVQFIMLYAYLARHHSDKTSQQTPWIVAGVQRVWGKRFDVAPPCKQE